jgi:glycosyltransferase involved in cell wall biosynthesis
MRSVKQRAMFRGARIAVVVPAHNEARLVARTIRGVPGWVDHVVVVDDASTDATFSRARAEGDHRTMVVQHDENLGVGAAIATGYRLAFALGADVAVVMAGDNQMDPADLERLIEPVVSGTADYAKGDRLSWPGARKLMPLGRFLGCHAFTWLTRACTGLGVSDSQCGYTAISRRASDRIDLDGLFPRYGYPNDLLGRLADASLVVRDVPVRPVYGDEVSGLGLRHAVFVIPMVLLRVVLRRVARLWIARPQGTAHTLGR